MKLALSAAACAAFLCVASAAASAELGVEYDSRGRITLSSNGEVVLKGLGLHPPRKRHGDRLTFEPRRPAQTAGGARVEVWNIRSRGGEPCAVMTRTVRRSGAAVDIAWRVAAKEDIAFQPPRYGGGGIEGGIPRKSFASGFWFRHAGGRLSVRPFPEHKRRIQNEGGLLDRFQRFTDRDFIGWVSASGNAVMVKLQGRMRLKIWNRGDYGFHYVWPGALRKGTVLDWSMRAEALGPEALKAICLKRYPAGRQSMLCADTQYEQVSRDQNRAGLLVRNLLPVERNVTVDYRVTDEILRTIESGSFEARIPPMGELRKRAQTGVCKRQDYRVFVDVRDSENNVTEFVKTRYEFDVRTGPRRRIRVSRASWDTLPRAKASYPPKGQWRRRSSLGAPRGWLRKKLSIPAGWRDKRVFIRFSNPSGLLRAYW